MWWFKRNILNSASLLIGLTLAGCTLEPLYKPGSVTAGFLQNIELDAPKDRDSYVLYNRLTERLHSAESSAYALSVTLRKSEARAGIAADGQAQRKIVTGFADYRIVQIATGKEVQSGSVKAFTGYAQSGSNVAILAASNDAYDRLMIQLADKIMDGMILTQSPAQP
ncbi:LPS assembly lipoprotein LptE [Rhodobacteraceae bacterium]|nr:LPS assembly lipoprotein LptE [Paracoccaceae bacterium]